MLNLESLWNSLNWIPALTFDHRFFTLGDLMPLDVFVKRWSCLGRYITSVFFVIYLSMSFIATPQSGNRVSTSFGNSGLYWTVFARNRDTAVPAEGNGDLQTLICVLVARPRWCLTLSNPVPWQNWMAAYLGYTLRMKTLFRGWPVNNNNNNKPTISNAP